MSDQFQTMPNPERWISVEGRLPANGQICIGWDGQFLYPCKFFDCEDYVGDGKHQFINVMSVDWDEVIEVTHWAPLPKPPKGEHNEDTRAK